MADRSLESTLLHVARARLLDDYPGQIDACLDALDEEQFWWRPHESANAVGNLLLHLAGSNRYYLGHAIAGLPDGRDRDAEFAARGAVSKAEARRVWGESLAVVGEVLERFDPARLMETTDRTGKPTTYAQIILHVMGHVAVHTGQIVYVTKQLRPGAIVELWMAMRRK